jgi:hypothetical protein
MDGVCISILLRWRRAGWLGSVVLIALVVVPREERYDPRYTSRMMGLLGTVLANVARRYGIILRAAHLIAS